MLKFGIVTEALRPLTIGELLDRTFFLYRRHFALFVGIAAIPGLFRLAAQILVTLATPAVASVSFTLLALLAGMFLLLATAALTQAATVVAVSRLHLGRETTIADAFDAIRPRLGEFMALIVSMSLRILVGFMFLVVPGVLLALMYALTMPVAVLEGKGVSASLARSAELTQGHRGRIFLIYLLLFALILIVTLVWQVPTMIATNLLQDGEGSVVGQLLLQVGGFATQAVLGPVVTIAIALVYYDERVRKEAFDLEHMMQQLDRAVPASSPTA
jgi:hypothetical protein